LACGDEVAVVRHVADLGLDGRHLASPNEALQLTS
jgi:hypothetical protein